LPPQDKTKTLSELDSLLEKAERFKAAEESKLDPSRTFFQSQRFSQGIRNLPNIAGLASRGASKGGKVIEAYNATAPQVVKAANALRLHASDPISQELAVKLDDAASQDNEKNMDAKMFAIQQNYAYRERLNRLPKGRNQ